MKSQEIQFDYTAYGSGYQLKLPMDTEIFIPKDDPVRLLSAICERIDYEELYAAYSEEGRKEYSPRILFKVITYGYMRKICSTRGIERACLENVKFMHLLEDHPAPDHNTIGRFRKHRLCETMEGLFHQLVELLVQAGEIDLSTVFIDGTKIEAQANRYTFVWKKGVEKRLAKLLEKMAAEWPKLEVILSRLLYTFSGQKHLLSTNYHFQSGDIKRSHIAFFLQADAFAQITLLEQAKGGFSQDI